MANRFPLTLVSTTITELPSGDNLDLTGCGIVNAGAVTASSFTETSDRRLKSNIQQLTGALDTVMSLVGTSYVKDGRESIGLIAQDVETIVPQLVLTADDSMGTKSVAYGNIVAILIEAIKEQQAQIDDLKKKIG